MSESGCELDDDIPVDIGMQQKQLIAHEGVPSPAPAPSSAEMGQSCRKWDSEHWGHIVEFGNELVGD